MREGAGQREGFIEDGFELLGIAQGACQLRAEEDLLEAAVADEERIPLPARIRDVEQGPDGRLYLLTGEDEGSVWRMTPLE